MWNNLSGWSRIEDCGGSRYLRSGAERKGNPFKPFGKLMGVIPKLISAQISPEFCLHDIRFFTFLFDQPMSTNFWMKHVGEMKMIYNLPAMKGLRLIKWLCKEFLLGEDSIYVFPNLHNLPRTGTLWFQKIKFNPYKGIVKFQNLFKGMKVEDVENLLLGS
ncbi:uncharacterized protein VP01_1361g4 [Puccinia sorghi]|uniref:Uncharacterized protein n=1 Tax=Puccinia sorghi TaxID=27349 RepID=A0A0L6VLW0_9BASI|nr:uncharacterized protein VP01_1361g4 [Puccinia sorghi]